MREARLKSKATKTLQSSELQFGFNEKFSCSHAIYIVTEVLSYFNKANTTVNMTALDISKAFDKVNHFVLFNKLLDRGVPTCLVKVLVCWYRKCNAVVRRNGRISRAFLPREAMLSAVYAVVVCLSVCVSVTLRYCIKTAKRRITQTTPHDSPMTLVF